MDRLIEKRQLRAWILTAMIAPLASCMAGQPWIAVGITAAVCMVLCGTLHNHIRTDVSWPGWFRLLEGIWTGITLSQLLRYLPEIWPQARHPWIVVIVVLLTALWAVRAGAESCARTGTTLSWLVSVLMALVVAAALKDVKPENLRPQFRLPEMDIIFILMIPCVGILLPRRERGSGGFELPVGIAAVAAAILTAGVLSPQVAESGANAFYEMSRTLTFSHAAQRFEALVSAGMTVSWFLLLCLLLCVCGAVATGIKPDRERYGAAAGAALAALLYLCDLRIPNTILAVGGVIFWGLLPVLAQGIVPGKKMLKNEKKA